MTQASTSLNMILLTVSGSKFEISKKILSAYPNTRLGKMVNSFEISGYKELHFDRPLASFESILSFYQTGKLHFPPNVCPIAFKEEMDFWEISEDNLEKCCLFSYIKFVETYKSKTEFHDEQNMDCPSSEKVSVRQRIWTIIDFQENTWISKMILLIGLLFVLTSVITVAIGSLPRYRRHPSACEWLEYISSIDEKDKHKDVTELFEKHKCHSLASTPYEDTYVYFYFMYPEYDNFSSFEYDYSFDGSNNSYVNSSSWDFIVNGSELEKINASLPDVTFKSDIFLKIDYFTTAYFTFELIVRLLVCPGLIWYYKNSINALDSLILLGTFSDIAVVHLNKGYKFSPDLMNTVDVIKLLRVIRLWRFCQHLTIVRVLKFSIKHNLNDLFVLLLYIVIVVMLCANILFMSELRHDVSSIPQGWWLAFVTMTTVGFGDLTPKSVFGKLACCFCALCGIFTLAIITPIFVETFTSVYCIAKMGNFKKKEENRKNAKEHRENPVNLM